MAPRDQGAPDYTKYLHPLMAKNYGQWDYHERLRPFCPSCSISEVKRWPTMPTFNAPATIATSSTTPAT
ncbi:hypothetical protein WCLP8_3690002 [uncultured Gammaproteobacteria bacterium]